VSARYWVLASDELMNSDPQWPEGLRPVRMAEEPPPGPGMNWWLFEDDTASPSLEGQKVELSFGTGGAGGAEFGRRMVG